MSFYESTFIFRQDLPAQDAHKLSSNYKDFVSKIGGKVLKREYWGLRGLAYKMKKSKRGHYVFFVMDADHYVIKKLEDKFKLDEDVIRFMSVKIDKYDSKPSLMMQTPDEIEAR